MLLRSQPCEGGSVPYVPPLSLPPPATARGGSLDGLVAFLNTAAGLRVFKKAFRDNMLYKAQRYAELLERSHRAAEEALEVINLKMPDLKRAARIEADDRSDHWNIFETVSGPYREAKGRSSQFEAVLKRARARLTGTMAFDRVTADDAAKGLRDDLVSALERLSNFAAQGHIVAKVVDIVASFLKDPRLFRTKLLNFMMMGGAGTGKTTLAEAIGDVLAKAGMFVGNNLIEAGRGELVGQYMGETVAKTRSFLVSNLDAGVIFVDEAYAITPWEDGKPESYGTEAATAMVEFMTRYQGLYCLITAGYERDMTRYFLPANEGLDRRFPNKFVLADMSPDELVLVFKRQLLRAQGLTVPNAGSPLASERYFSPAAYAYLRGLLAVAMQGDTSYADEVDPRTRRTYRRVRTFRPRWECLHRVFEHQAGAMANLADEAVTVLYATIRFEDVLAAQRRKGRAARPPIREQGVQTMRDIVVQRIRSMAFSDVDAFLRELEQVERG